MINTSQIKSQILAKYGQYHEKRINGIVLSLDREALSESRNFMKRLINKPPKGTSGRWEKRLCMDTYDLAIKDGLFSKAEFYALDEALQDEIYDDLAEDMFYLPLEKPEGTGTLEDTDDKFDTEYELVMLILES